MQAADLRVTNLSVVLRAAVASAEPRSRADIAQDSGLAKPTVSNMVEALIAAGLLTEGEAVHRGPGRPSTPLVLPERGVVGVGLEVTADHLGARAVNLAGAPVVDVSHQVNLVDDDPDASIDRVARLLDEVLSSLAGHKVAGVCVSIPGRLSADRTTVESAPNLAWQDMPFLARLAAHPTLAKRRQQVPGGWGISLHNDAQLAARLELTHREPDASFVYVFGETGIGGAVVFNGRVYVGENGWAGEIGHIAVESGGALCRCGRRGCLEAHASYHALRERAGLGPDVSISDIVDTLAERIGDRATVVEMIGRPLGYALAATLNVLDLSTVVLGGYLAPIVPELSPVVHSVLREKALAEEHGPVRVEPAAADPHPALSGATLMALEPVLNRTADWIENMAAG